MLAVASDIPTLASLGGQPASTAINTSNIGSQSVNYANTAGNANAVFGISTIGALQSALGITNAVTTSAITLKCDDNEYTAPGQAGVYVDLSTGSYSFACSYTTITINALGSIYIRNKPGGSSWQPTINTAVGATVNVYPGNILTIATDTNNGTALICKVSATGVQLALMYSGTGWGTAIWSNFNANVSCVGHA